MVSTMSIIVRLEVLDISPVEGLCAECWLPSLVQAVMAPCGPALAGLIRQVVCTDCGLVQ